MSGPTLNVSQMQNLWRIASDPRLRLDHLHRTAEGVSLHLDANETANLDRALRHVEAEVHRIEFPAVAHAEDIPLDTSTPEWAEEVEYNVYESSGKLEPIGDWADDLPRSDVVKHRNLIPVKDWGGAYAYSMKDLIRNTAPGATNLPNERALANREVAEEHVDRTAYLGHKPSGIRGLMTNDLIEILTPEVNGGDSTWEAKIANGSAGIESVVKDLTTGINSVNIATNGIHMTSDVRMDVEQFELIRTTRYNTNNDKTILQYVQGLFPEVVFKPRARLNGLHRVLFYKKSPAVLKHKLVMPYRVFPPQAKNLAFIVNGIVRTAGTHIYKPECVKYLDGASA